MPNTKKEYLALREEMTKKVKAAEEQNAQFVQRVQEELDKPGANPSRKSEISKEIKGLSDFIKRTLDESLRMLNEKIDDFDDDFVDPQSITDIGKKEQLLLQTINSISEHEKKIQLLINDIGKPIQNLSTAKAEIPVSVEPTKLIVSPPSEEDSEKLKQLAVTLEKIAKDLDEEYKKITELSEKIKKETPTRLKALTADEKEKFKAHLEANPGCLLIECDPREDVIELAKLEKEKSDAIERLFKLEQEFSANCTSSVGILSKYKNSKEIEDILKTEDFLKKKAEHSKDPHNEKTTSRKVRGKAAIAGLTSPLDLGTNLEYYRRSNSEYYAADRYILADVSDTMAKNPTTFAASIGSNITSITQKKAASEEKKDSKLKKLEEDMRQLEGDMRLEAIQAATTGKPSINLKKSEERKKSLQSNIDNRKKEIVLESEAETTVSITYPESLNQTSLTGGLTKIFDALSKSESSEAEAAHKKIASMLRNKTSFLSSEFKDLQDIKSQVSNVATYFGPPMAEKITEEFEKNQKKFSTPAEKLVAAKKFAAEFSSNLSGAINELKPKFEEYEKAAQEKEAAKKVPAATATTTTAEPTTTKTVPTTTVTATPSATAASTTTSGASTATAGTLDSASQLAAMGVDPSVINKATPAILEAALKRAKVGVQIDAVIHFIETEAKKAPAAAATTTTAEPTTTKTVPTTTVTATPSATAASTTTSGASTATAGTLDSASQLAAMGVDPSVINKATPAILEAALKRAKVGVQIDAVIHFIETEAKKAPAAAATTTTAEPTTTKTVPTTTVTATPSATAASTTTSGASTATAGTLDSASQLAAMGVDPSVINKATPAILEAALKRAKVGVQIDAVIHFIETEAKKAPAAAATTTTAEPTTTKTVPTTTVTATPSATAASTTTSGASTATAGTLDSASQLAAMGVDPSVINKATPAILEAALKRAKVGVQIDAVIHFIETEAKKAPAAAATTTTAEPTTTKTVPTTTVTATPSATAASTTTSGASTATAGTLDSASQLAAMGVDPSVINKATPAILEAALKRAKVGVQIDAVIHFIETEAKKAPAAAATTTTAEPTTTKTVPTTTVTATPSATAASTTTSGASTATAGTLDSASQLAAMGVDPSVINKATPAILEAALKRAKVGVQIDAVIHFIETEAKKAPAAAATTTTAEPTTTKTVPTTTVTATPSATAASTTTSGASTATAGTLDSASQLAAMGVDPSVINKATPAILEAALKRAKVGVQIDAVIHFIETEAKKAPAAAATTTTAEPTTTKTVPTTTVTATPSATAASTTTSGASTATAGTLDSASQLAAMGVDPSVINKATPAILEAALKRAKVGVQIDAVIHFIETEAKKAPAAAATTTTAEPTTTKTTPTPAATASPTTATPSITPSTTNPASPPASSPASLVMISERGIAAANSADSSSLPKQPTMHASKDKVTLEDWKKIKAEVGAAAKGIDTVTMVSENKMRLDTAKIDIENKNTEVTVSSKSQSSESIASLVANYKITAGVLGEKGCSIDRSPSAKVTAELITALIDTPPPMKPVISGGVLADLKAEVNTNETCKKALESYERYDERHPEEAAKPAKPAKPAPTVSPGK